METVMFVLAVRAHGAWSRSRARLVFERFFNRGDGSRAQALCSTTTPSPSHRGRHIALIVIRISQVRVCPLVHGGQATLLHLQQLVGDTVGVHSVVVHVHGVALQRVTQRAASLGEAAQQAEANRRMS